MPYGLTMVETLRKGARLEIRVTPQQKDLFARAAFLQGATMTEFSIHSLQEAARQAIQAHEQLLLSARDSQVFVHALLGTTEVPRKLKEAFSRHTRND